MDYKIYRKAWKKFLFYKDIESFFEISVCWIISTIKNKQINLVSYTTLVVVNRITITNAFSFIYVLVFRFIWVCLFSMEFDLNTHIKFFVFIPFLHKYNGFFLEDAHHSNVSFFYFCNTTFRNYFRLQAIYLFWYEYFPWK